MRYYLVKESGPVAAPAVIHLKGNQEVTIGRSPDATVSIAAVRISRVHAILRQIDDQWHILDNKSLNGIFINEKKVPPMTNYRLDNGDLILFGLSNELSSRMVPYEPVCTYRCTTSKPITSMGSSDSDEPCGSNENTPRLPRHGSSTDQFGRRTTTTSSSIAGATSATTSAKTTVIKTAPSPARTIPITTARALTASQRHTSDEEHCSPRAMSSLLKNTDAVPLLPLPATDLQQQRSSLEQDKNVQPSRVHFRGTRCTERSSSACSEDRQSSHAEYQLSDRVRTVHGRVAAAASEVGGQACKPPSPRVITRSTSAGSTTGQLPERQNFLSPQPSKSRVTMHRKRPYLECFSEEKDTPSEAAAPARRRKVAKGTVSALDSNCDDAAFVAGHDGDDVEDNPALTHLWAKADALSLAVAEELRRRQDLEAELTAVRLRGEELQCQAEQARSEAEQARSEAEQARCEAKRVQSHIEQLRSEAEQLRSSAEQARSSAEQARREADLARKEAMDGFAQILEKELQCTICCDLIVKAKSLGCSHTFCSYCIDKWLVKSNECPCCRQRVRNVARCCAIDNCIEKAVEHMSEERQAMRREQVEERKNEQGKAARNVSSDRRHLPTSASAADLETARGTLGPFGAYWNMFSRSERNASLAATVNGNRSAASTRSRRSAVASASAAAVLNAGAGSSAPRRSVRLQARGRQSAEPGSSHVVLIDSSDEDEEATVGHGHQPTTAAAESSSGSGGSSSSSGDETEAPAERDSSSTSDGDNEEEGGGHQGNDDADGGADALLVTEVVHDVEQGAIFVFDGLEPFSDADLAEHSDGSWSDDDSDEPYVESAAPAEEQAASDRSGSRYYVRGVPGSYFGGYGYCYSCGCRGHWANGCPYRV